MAGLGWGAFRVGNAGGASLTASSKTFNTSTATGAIIATLSNPFSGATTYAVVGTAPGQLALDGSAIKAGSTAATGGTGYSIKVRATSADGKREVAETLAFTAIGTGSPPLIAPTGFAMNGSTNSTLKAAISRVKAGTGRGTIVQKGDSTTAGVGASIESGTATVAVQFAGARPFRPSAVIASQLSNAGIPALDNAFVGDAGITASNQSANVSLSQYDGRFAYAGASPWFVATNSQNFAGGGFFNGNGSKSPIEFTPTNAVDTFKLVVFNSGSAHTITIDGAAPASITAPGATVSGNAVTPPATNNGFTTITVTAASAGTHTVRDTPSGSGPLLRSIQAFNSAVPALDIINHGSASAVTSQQAAAGSNWSNNDALGYDAPDLTIINLGLNDGATNVAVSTYMTGIQAIVTKAKMTGDVLLISPHPANPSNFSSVAKQIELRDALSSFATSNNIAYLDLYTYFQSWSAVSARTADNTVHPNKGMYAEIGEVVSRCVRLMAA